MTNRNITFDIMKGIGILLVIVGHLDLIPMDPQRRIIFSFHMPLFFILSGYFFKFKSLRQLIDNDYKRLVIPYIYTACVFLIVGVLRSYIHKDPSFFLIEIIKTIYCSGSPHHSMLLPNIPSIGAIWFLMALFWCRLIYTIISSRYFNYRYFVGGGISIVATLIDYYIINLPFAILPGISAIMFYSIGDFLKSTKEMKRTTLWRPLLFVVGFSCSVISISYSHMWMVQCSYGMYPIDIVAGCFGTYIVYKVSQFANSHIPSISKMLVWCGQNSLTILCLHLIELKIWVHLHIPQIWWVIVICKFAFVIIGTILLYYIPHFRKVFSIVGINKFDNKIV